MILIERTIPKTCYDCPCTNDGFYRCLLEDKQLDDDCEQRRPTWCPLHEVTADPDPVSRAQVLETFSDLYFIFDDYKEVQKEFDAVYDKLRGLPPSPTPSRPQEHEKSCEGCEWEDDAYSQCQRCTRNYTDFYQEKRNGGCGMSDNTEFSDGFSAGYAAGYRACKDRYKPQWIPCTERLPETRGKYIVSVKLDGQEYSDKDYWLGDRWNNYLKRQVIAWQPSPEPYKGVDA